MECPICYDEIETTKNCITTDCGHKFHAKCLMKNAHINGFSCPSCRAQMVEQEPEDVTESESDSTHIYLGDDDDETVQLEYDRSELSDERQHQMWEEQREAEFVRSEEQAFELSEQELVRIRDSRLKCRMISLLRSTNTKKVSRLTRITTMTETTNKMAKRLQFNTLANTL